MAGHTQFLLGSMGPTMPIVKSGRLRGIAVTTPKRTPALPDVPTVTESGVKGYEVVNWHGLMGPKGLPQPIVERLNGELNKILKSKDMEDKLAADGVYAAGGPPEQMTAVLKRDIDRWIKVAKQTGVKATD
jgi:tripartite-type tricarboxylate transporter receptor subunit TctC